MVHHKDERDIPFAADIVFNLVADIEDYPDFVPWCEAVRIKRREIHVGYEKIIAEMIAQYKVFRERFTSEVRLDRQNAIITAKYVSGPLNHLYTTWRFVPNGENRTILMFEIDFAFKNRLVQSAATYAFPDIFRQMADVFNARAAQVVTSAEHPN